MAWVGCAPLPVAARHLDAAAWGGYVYALGLGNSSGNGTNLMYRYDPSSDSWSSRANLPSARTRAGVAVSPSGRIYLISGYSTSSTTNGCSYYDPSSNTWTGIANLPAHRVDAGCVSDLSGRIYVIGGSSAATGGSQQSTVYRYDPSTNTWSTLASLPAARQFLTAALGPSGEVYAIGGQSTAAYRYDASADSWSSVASAPAAISHTQAASDANGNIYTAGSYASAAPQKVFYRYDPVGDLWESLTLLPEAITANGVAINSDGFIYSVAGLDSSNSNTDVVYRYRLNQPPYPPVITTPALNEVIDKDVTNRITVPFNDPDTGDTQSKLDIRWWDLDASGNRVGGAHTHTHSNPQQYWDAPGGTFTVGDKEMQGQSYDAQGEPSGWGPSTFFTAEVRPNPPTITYPANNGNVVQNDRLDWSTPNQDAYHVQVWDSSDVLVDDLGQKANSIPRTQPLAFPDNNVVRKIAVRIKFNGLWSDWAVIVVNVTYTQPVAAVVTCTPDAAKGAIQVDWTNSDPGTPVPAPVYVDLYVRTAAADDGKDEYRPYNARGIRIAKDLPPNSGFLDRRTSSGIKYEYQVKTVGDNDTSIDSGWTA